LKQTYDSVLKTVAS